mmetsp:Transcript_5616/g.17278  ORF Transcript_5616/g.17278 Transcript_5616/m.17278 type:complete len:96 (-) Transcript_5616:600-887(-)
MDQVQISHTQNSTSSQHRDSSTESVKNALAIDKYNEFSFFVSKFLLHAMLNNGLSDRDSMFGHDKDAFFSRLHLLQGGQNIFPLQYLAKHGVLVV